MNENKGCGVAVIGGGAAGLMAAISAARIGVSVTVFEKNDRFGKKLAITGKGRCNVTNDCSVEEFLQNVPTNPRFLYSALGRFDTKDTQDFFESAGVPLKVERGRRVFPVSDKAGDIVSALVRTAGELGVDTVSEKVISLKILDSKVCGVVTERGEYSADAVIICTGGKSYPRTGSDGDGYGFARAAGHSVTKLLPSLVPLTSQSRICPSLQGLSLKNVSLSIVRKSDGREIYSDFGEMMFTHFGLTGPMVLSASAHIPDIASGNYEAQINLKPALDEKTLDARILADFNKYSNKDFVNALGDLLPQKMIPVVISLSRIDERKKVNSITKEERHALVSVIRCLKIPLSGFRPINEAIITKGGVSVKEINPKTMESKICSRLYFAGEVIDVDAYTGGYNLQIAFSTGVLAGESAAFEVLG
ncbi:MAG: NAD(P)/FAD-dependent oxidoreductase [Clostridia bacterium]|nr:NAD(P)/FAD-dependent oxidoreductase [Clostridia bacterium]